MLKANYHTHMQFCNHAEGMVEDYVKKAIELGMEELGMSDHAPILESFMTKEEYEENWGYDSMRMEQIPEYLKQIEECQKKYPEIKIYSGFETEYLPHLKEYYKDLKTKVDYLNLGIHFFMSKGHVINTYTMTNEENLEDYVKAIEEALELGIYTCVVHPDLFMYGYRNKNNEFVFDTACEKATRRIAELALKYDVYLEVNSNGLKYCKDKKDRSTWLYPYPRFFEILKEYPVKLIIGCDAHTPDSLGNENVAFVEEFVKDLHLPILEKMVIR